MEVFAGNILLTVVVMIPIGLGIGVLAGLLGVGGGVVMIPVFRVILGMAPINCAATSLTTIIFTMASGATTRLRNKTCMPKLSLAIGCAGACLSPFGAMFANQVEGWLIIGVCATCILVSAMCAIPNIIHPKSQEESMHMPTVAPKQYVVMACVGAVAGFLSGFVGIGGGFVIMPFLLRYIKLSTRIASGTSLCAVFLLIIPGAITQMLQGNVMWAVCLATAIGAIPGAVIGSKLAKKIQDKTLSIGLFVFMVFSAAALVVNELGLLG